MSTIARSPRFHAHLPRHLACLLLALAVPFAGRAAAQETPPDPKPSERGEVVYSKQWRSGARDAEPRQVRETGELTEEILQRVGRPWSHFGADELYHEEAWSTSDGGDDGESAGADHGYRIYRQPNPSPTRLEPTSGPPEVTAEARRLVAELPAGERLVLNVKLRNFPEWDVPLRVAGFGFSEQQVAANERQREAAMERRGQLLDRSAQGVERALEAAGGEILYRYPSVGWVTVAGSPEMFERLAARDDLERITPAAGEVVDHGVAIGDLRVASRLDADRFHQKGYTGEIGNSQRHPFGDLVAGVIESGLLEDEACAFFDGANCQGTKRIQERFVCRDDDSDGNFCEPVNNFIDSDDGPNKASHGTAVAAAVLADYMDNQGCGEELGDPGWGGVCHSSTWERQATAMAPEARLIFFGGLKSGFEANSFEDAFDDAIDRHVDVINNSWGWGGSSSRCNPKPIQIFEEELENAFDDGIFIVSSAGNSCGARTSSCNFGSPGDTLKSFAVNALDMSLADCGGDYRRRCRVDHIYSARGGADIEVDGVLRKKVISGIDMAAPSRFGRGTGAGGARGTVSGVNGEFRGTSAAAPVVAGLSLLVKNWYLAGGEPWINLPGRLHTVMLAMTDRHRSSDPASSVGATSQGVAFGDSLYGFGRPKLRLLRAGGDFKSWANSFVTRSFAPGSPSYSYVPFEKPMPVDTAIVKCVMLQSEDLSSKDDISNLDLELRVHKSNLGSCNLPGETLATRIDASFDVKSMVALVDGEPANLGGLCPQVTIRKKHVTLHGITAHVMCYYADRMDDM